MIWKSVLFRPESLYEALFRQKLLGSGSETVVGTDYTPYLYRSAPSFGQPYNRQRPSVVGGSVAWNQLMPNSNFTGTASPSNAVVSYDATTDTTSFSATIGSQGWGYVSRNIPKLTENHVYLLSCHVETQSPTIIWAKPAASGDTPQGYSVTSGFYTCLQKPTSTSSGSATETTCLLGVAASEGTVVTVDFSEVMLTDLTALWGSTVADAIYAMEQATAGSGVAYFKSLFREDYYAYDSGSLESVQTSAHVIRDANDTVIGNYALDPNLVLRGIPKWVDGALRYDGDIYHANGTVERRFAERPYESGDESLADAITDGTNTVYKLTTPTTESADPYTALQVADPYGTEEWVTSGIVPVGQETEYIQK